jgi:hypothetical protein
MIFDTDGTQELLVLRMIALLIEIAYKDAIVNIQKSLLFWLI